VSAPGVVGDPFRQRYAVWAGLRAREGAARAYPHAWRLPELARQHGRAAQASANLALGLTLYELGRFAEARAALPAPDDDCDLDTLAMHAACACQLASDDACPELCADPRLLAATPAALAARSWLCFLRDDAVAVPPLCHAWQSLDAGSARDWPVIWRHWAERRQGLGGDEPAAHTALARLRRHAPAAAVLAVAAHAEAAFHRGAAWSQVWLNEALAQCECYGQHHLKARLLWLKARALGADGQLADADRFAKLAHTLARRQGAALQERLMARHPYGLL